MTEQVEGAEQVQKNLAKLAGKYGDATVAGVMEFAQLVRTDAIKSIQSTSNGEAVTRTSASGNSYSHTSSKPGDAPNTDTGRLAGSVQVDVKPSAIFVGSTLYYAGYLEFGTRSMSARPWLFPALEGNKKNAPRIVAKHLKKVKL
jgi:HK97 gp10 family phage protein